jgi:hypothetical protein
MNRDWNRGLDPNTNRPAPCATQFGNGCMGQQRPIGGWPNNSNN